jgi:hypothetical protein
MVRSRALLTYKEEYLRIMLSLIFYRLETTNPRETRQTFEITRLGQRKYGLRGERYQVHLHYVN